MTDSEIEAYLAAEPTAPPTRDELVGILQELAQATRGEWTYNSDQEKSGWLIPSDDPIVGRISRALGRAGTPPLPLL